VMMWVSSRLACGALLELELLELASGAAGWWPRWRATARTARQVTHSHIQPSEDGEITIHRVAAPQNPLAHLDGKFVAEFELTLHDRVGQLQQDGIVKHLGAQVGVGLQHDRAVAKVSCIDLLALRYQVPSSCAECC